jgi:proteasome lid subunit RPN8/RPN11
MLAMMMLPPLDFAVVGDPAPVSATLPVKAAASDLIHEPVVVSFCEILVRKAKSEREAEQAAFVVRTAGGILYFVWWPANGERNSAQWRGSFPLGTVAIVHTHPPWLPAPSNVDVTTARRTGVPVYVVTRSGISMTSGGPPVTLIEGEWIAAP